MHIHGAEVFLVDETGYLTQGFKDTVNVPATGSRHVLVYFNSQPGVFMQHCHMLEHEDHEVCWQQLSPCVEMRVSV